MSEYDKVFQELIDSANKLRPTYKINNVNEDQLKFIREQRKRGLSCVQIAGVWNMFAAKLGWFTASKSLIQKIDARYLKNEKR